MKVFLLLILLSLASCIAGKGDVKIDIKNKKSKAASSSTISNASISSVQIINNQLVITGTGLIDVENVKVDGNSLNENFSIETKSATQIIANSIRAFSFDVSKVFSLILSDASASATFPIDFSLCNSTLNGKGFDCVVAAMDKDVLSFDQATNKWKPRSINGLSYQGSWDATDPLPSTTTPGDYFIVSVASAPYGVGDWIVWNGGSYDQISNSTTITSVFGRTGAVVGVEGDYDLNKLLDVDLTVAPTAGKILKFDGTKWIAGDDLSGGGAGSITSTELADGSVTDAKIVAMAATKLTGTITSAQIADGAIVNADINASAAIDYSKLNIPTASIPYAKLNIADGDIPAAKISGLPSATSILATTIVNADTTHAPDGNAVFDALGLKLNLTGGTLSIGTISGVPTPTNSDDVANKGYADTRDALRLAKAGDTMTGALTLDSDLKIKGGSNYVTVKGHATSATYNLTLPSSAGTSGYVLSTDGSGNTSWVDVTSAVTNLDTDDVDEATNLYFTEARVLGTDLAGLNTGVAGPIAAADTVLGAMGKLQYQVTDLKAKGQWDKAVNDISYSAGNVSVDKKIRLKDSATNYVELVAPATVTSTYTLTFPANDGNSNQVLRTDGAGVLTWVDLTDSSVQAFAKAALPTCAGGEVLKSNGTSFSCVTDNSGAAAFSGTASKAVVTGAGGALEVSATTSTEVSYLAGVTSAIQAQINGKQATDTTLTALAAFNTNGIMVQTAADTFVGRSIAGTANRVAVTNGDGVSGNPTVNVSTTLLPSPVVGDVGKYLKATAADTSAWTALSSLDITTALGFTPIDKAGDSISTGLFTLSGTAVLRTPDPIGVTDVANKQYVDGFGQWTKTGSDIYRSGGNVGLGTTAPDRRLTVIGDGTTYGDDAWFEGTNSETATPQINLVRSRGTLAARTPVTATDVLGTVAFRGNHANGGTTFPYAGRIDGIAETDFATQVNGVLAFLTTSAGTIAEKMRITSTGFVGIGTSNPTSNFHLLRTTATTPIASFVDNTAASNFSDVEIDAFRPGIVLRDKSTNADDFRIGVDEGKLTFSADLDDDASKGADSNYNDSAMMTILSNGRVGIGTTAPAYQLDILKESGDAAVRGIAYTTAATSGGTFIGARARGTAAAPTHPLANDLMAQYLGKNAITGITNPGMIIYAGENQTSTALGDYISFLTTPNTGTVSTEKMRITGSGFVGINNATPLSQLDIIGDAIVSGGSSSLQLKAGATDDHTYMSFFARSATPALRTAYIGVPAAGATNMNFANETATGSLVYITNSTERMRLDASGNLGINTVGADAKLMVDSGTTIGRYTAAGWTHSSDARLKHDIHTITDATEKILKLRGVNYILNKDSTNERQLGFIAQEVEPYFPEVVRTDKAGYKSMVYSNLIAPLVEAFKDLYKKVTDIFVTTEKNTRAIASVNLKMKKLEEENAAKTKEIAELKTYLCLKDPRAPICK